MPLSKRKTCANGCSRSNMRDLRNFRSDDFWRQKIVRKSATATFKAFGHRREDGDKMHNWFSLAGISEIKRENNLPAVWITIQSWNTSVRTSLERIQFCIWVKIYHQSVSDASKRKMIEPTAYNVTSDMSLVTNERMHIEANLILMRLYWSIDLLLWDPWFCYLCSRALCRCSTGTHSPLKSIEF